MPGSPEDERDAPASPISVLAGVLATLDDRLLAEIRAGVSAPLSDQQLAAWQITALMLAGYALVRTNGVIEPGIYDADTSADGYYLTPVEP